MKKVFVILTGVYLVLLGFLVMLSMGMVFISYRLNSAQFPPNFNPLLAVLTNLPIMAWLFATGIGLFIYKNWARISMFVLSGFAIFVGICMTAVFTLMPMPDIDSGSSSAVKGIILIFTLIFAIILPIIYFIFFTRKSVVELFVDPAQSLGEPKRPVGISILAIISVVGAMMTIVQIFNSYPNGIPVFGKLFISGWGMQLYLGAMALISLFIAYGLWKLLKSAWYTYMALLTFAIINCLVGIFTYNNELLTKITNPPDISQMPPLMFFRIILGICLFFLAFIMVYLYKQRAWFKIGKPKGDIVNT